jgi:hypothetical protein
MEHRTIAYEARGNPLPLDDKVVNKHQQLESNSCIPMAAEFVLKLIGRAPVDYYDLQREWQNRADGDFGAFDGREVRGVRFRRQYALPRGSDFPFDGLRRTIEHQLAAGRYVIISLQNIGVPSFHMYVVYECVPTGTFTAVSKDYGQQGPLWMDDVWPRVLESQGTDILTYGIRGTKDPCARWLGSV